MVVVLLVTVFFFGHQPEARAYTLDTPEACEAARALAVTRLSARTDVKGVAAACFTINPADKA